MPDNSDPKHPTPPSSEPLLTGPLADALAKGLRAGADVVAANLVAQATPTPSVAQNSLTKLQRTMLWCVVVALVMGFLSALAVEDRKPAAVPTHAALATAQPASSTCTTVSTVEKKAADGTVTSTRTETKGSCESEKLSAGQSLGLRAAYYAVLAIF